MRSKLVQKILNRHCQRYSRKTIIVMDTPLSLLYSQYLESRTVTTDSRKITPGCIFFALKGEHFDGNTFAPQALAMGAALCVVDNESYATDSRCVVVPNVIEALQALARHHRQQLDIPVIGITGTNGKTTTKELLHAVLSKRYRTHATQGNYNNHLGVPLTLLAMPADTQVAIIEMGANHPGEIDHLCSIAQPTFGLITNVGKAHLEGFGSFEGVVETKTELYRHIAAARGTLFVNADNRVLMERASALATIAEERSAVPGCVPALLPVLGACHEQQQLSLLTYGHGDDAEVKGTYLGSAPCMACYFEQGDSLYRVQSHLLGGYNFDNAMAAVAVGLHFNVEPFDIKTALENYEPENHRSQYKATAHNTLVLDCYNANPSSMEVAIDNFEALPKPHKVVMLGGMKELGAESEREHQQLVQRLRYCHFESVVLVGDEFAFAKTEPTVMHFANVEQAKQHFTAHPLSEKTILIKGSNGTRMWLLEEIL